MCSAELATGGRPALLIYGYRWLKRHATGIDDIVLIINDDTEIEPDFLANAAISNLQPRSLLLAQQYTAADRRLVEVGVKMDWKSFIHTTTRGVSPFTCRLTRGLFLRVRDLLEIGGFIATLCPIINPIMNSRCEPIGWALI